MFVRCFNDELRADLLSPERAKFSIDFDEEAVAVTEEAAVVDMVAAVFCRMTAAASTLALESILLMLLSTTISK